jgi:hypothetical protein
VVLLVVWAPGWIECIDSQTDCSGCNSFVYNETYVDECSDNTSINDNDKTCKDCQKDEFIFNSSCTTACSDGFMKENNTCNSCKSKINIFINQLVLIPVQKVMLVMKKIYVQKAMGKSFYVYMFYFTYFNEVNFSL